MAYRETKKARKVWSERANEKQARDRIQSIEDRNDPIEDFITIKINRKLTGETALFELYPGDRCDNYTVYCNGERRGVMGITRVSEGIRKALPRVLSELA